MKRTIFPEQHPFYHNTLKLLQNYRDVNWSLEVSAQNLQSEFRAEYGGTSADYVDDLTISGDKGAATRIEGLTFSLDKSRRMMQLVNSAIALMRGNCTTGSCIIHICARRSPPQSMKYSSCWRSISSLCPFAPITADGKKRFKSLVPFSGGILQRNVRESCKLSFPKNSYYSFTGLHRETVHTLYQDFTKILI